MIATHQSVHETGRYGEGVYLFRSVFAEPLFHIRGRFAQSQDLCSGSDQCVLGAVLIELLSQLLATLGTSGPR